MADWIDELVDWQLSASPEALTAIPSRVCSMCRTQWRSLAPTCPGCGMAR